MRPRIRRLTFLLHRQHNNFAVSPFFSHVLHGVEDACREHGIVPSVLTAGPTEDVTEQMRLHAPDAIAVAGFVEPETLAAVAAMQRPLVLIDLWAPKMRSVNLDNVAGAALGDAAPVRARAQARSRSSAARSRTTASLNARSAIGAHSSRRACCSIRLLETSIDAHLPPDEGAALAMQRLLDAQGPERMPNAVFAYNDVAALAAMRVALARGLRVPEDIAFVGFDDIPAAVARHTGANDDRGRQRGARRTRRSIAA